MIVQFILEGLKNTLSKYEVRKEPVSIERLLQAMVEAGAKLARYYDGKKNLLKFFYMAALSHTSDKLFRTDESLGSRLRVLLLAKTEQLVMDPKLFGMHSLPVGRATANSGVPDRLFKHRVLEVRDC